MSKLYRSLLWSGVVVAGVAACGDDVTIPQPTPTVHSVSVGPTGVTIAAGTSLQMVASVNADPEITNLAVNWTINVPATVASISATGLLTTVAGQTGNIAVQACAQANTSVCGNATVIVALTAPGSPTVTSVDVSPASTLLTKPTGAATATRQFSASVIGTNGPSQTVTWSVVGAPAGASISNTGLLTITSAITVTSLNVSACATQAGFTNICGFATADISTAIPATISQATLTFVPAAGAPTNCTPTGAGSIPVTLTNVNCQIEVTATVNAGDIVLARMDVVMTNTCTVPPNTAANCSAAGNSRVMASHTFPGTVAAQEGQEPEVSAPAEITLSIDTRMVRSPTNSATNLVPSIFNGNATVELKLYTPTGQLVAATSPTPVVMTNADAVVYPTALVNTTNTPAGGFTTGGVTFFTGTQTVSGGQYIAFSQVVPTTASWAGTLCGASSSVIAGTPTTGITLGGVFSCAGVQGSNTVAATVPAFAYAVATGPDGTAIVPPAFFSTVGSAFQMPIAPPPAATTESRWNLILQGVGPVPAPTLLPTVGVDNLAPLVTVQGTGICAAANGGKVAFNDVFDQCWVNAGYAFAQDISASDAGGSGVALLEAHDYLVGVFVPPSAGCSAVVKTTGNDYAETVTSDGSPEGWRICAFARDNVGNTASSGPSNWFGVDKVAPTVRLAGSTAATPTIAPATFPAVSSTANTTIFSIASPFVVTDQWGLEAQDTRSGFDQSLAVSLMPASQTMLVLNPAIDPAAIVGCGFSNGLQQALSDNWVRANHMPPLAPLGSGTLDCALGAPGYFTFNGSVIDRAGNASSTITRNYAIDQYAAPTLSSVGPSAIFYTAGQPANFFLFGSDDLEIIDATLALTYPGMNAVTATLVSVTKPLSSITGCARWDATLCDILAGASAVDPYLFGRVDLTCTGAGTPYAGCAVVDGTTAVAAQYNNVDTDLDTVFEDDDKNPTGVSAQVFDVANQASGVVSSGLLTAQTNDVAQQWVGADLITWKVTSTAGGSVTAEHKASTSITAPYFDFVYLARGDVVAATTLIICGTFPAPALTDNGLNRFWTYTLAKPTGTHPCATATGNWYAVGVKNGAALVTIGLP